MRLTVRLFASLRERAGWTERLVTPEAEPATPLSVWRQLDLPAGETPGGDPPGGETSAPAASGTGDRGGNQGLPAGIRVAVNQAFAAADTPLSDGDELAFLPPISGG